MRSTASAARSMPFRNRFMSEPLWLLTLITFSGTFAMHSFVPALPEGGACFGCQPG